MPTDASVHLPTLIGVRAVLFDIYGTLLVSGSGDVGSSGKAIAAVSGCGDALREMGFREAGLDGELIIESLHDAIRAEHGRLRELGIDCPEVEIDRVWHDALRTLQARGYLQNALLDSIDFRRLAVEYEVRANPIDEMPGASRTLSQVRSRDLILGIVSNAQFFTLLAWHAQFGRSIEDMGFRSDMQYFSYQHRHAKPGGYLYNLAAERLAELGVEPHEVVYVGNDVRNDVAPALRVGFRAVLFAGDRRSLRLRLEDPELRDLQPTATITNLEQLLPLIGVDEAAHE